MYSETKEESTKISQPSIEHIKLLTSDVEPKQNPIGGPLNIA
jgi:hypothetical protein